MINILRTIKSNKHLLLISVCLILNSCSNLNIVDQKKHTTTHITFDILTPKIKSIHTDNTETNTPPKKIKPFKPNFKVDTPKLEQLNNWLSSNCQELSINWQNCINSLALVKKFNRSNKDEILAYNNIHSQNLFLAAYQHNQAELLLNQYNDRKYKIQAAHFFIQSKTLLAQYQEVHLPELRTFLIHLIELQLNNMVKQDEFLTILISKPLLVEKENTTIQYSMLNWSGHALSFNHNELKKIRKRNPQLNNNACLKSIEAAIKSQNKLNQKWATVYLTKRNKALHNAKTECENFPYRFYLFDQVFLLWPDIDWTFLNLNNLETLNTHSVFLQKYLFNSKVKSNTERLERTENLNDNYIKQNPLDIFMHYHQALKNNSISLNNPCFNLNIRYINCYQLLDNNTPITQLNDRDFVINQLAYVFPYELLLQQLRLRLALVNDELGIELDDREAVESSFNRLFVSQLKESNFSRYQLKLLYAQYSIFNLSAVFLNEKDTRIITDFFFTQEGYQLKWELSVIVQNILQYIQTQHYVPNNRT
ncbi:MAG: hypothetical protein HRU38_04100 [Saccharospirillaceae bacterium]|nr:hypothetical protein [Pseudomonadales bacterium]NRB77847.1 hypothetical protein [Saccharospirillaceae bacterium]